MQRPSVRLRSTGLAERCLLAPELEFFIFDDVRFEQREHEAFCIMSIPRKEHGIEGDPKFPTWVTRRARDWVTSPARPQQPLR